MKKLLVLFVSLSMILAACGTAEPIMTATVTSPAPTGTPLVATATPPTPSPTLVPTLAYPVEGYGPSNFPANIDPLTGLQVADPALLERRPLLVKVANLPRNNRPQWGLSLADIVFEYYTEEGTTRFAAVYLGDNADLVGPIRSGRFIDAHLVRGYKAIFAFGSAYIAEWTRFMQSEFANRIFIEGAGSNSPFSRYDPNGYDFLLVNTATLGTFAASKGVDNVRQNLDGMSFKLAPPAGGQPGTQVFVRYSAAIYNRWDYDPTTGKYLRFADNADDYNNNNEQYAQLTDRLTGKPIAFENVVVLYVNHEVYSTDSAGNKIYDILFSGSGDGVAFRDGQAYKVKWQRNDTDVVSLTNPDGTPFAFKPGTTWYEVMGLSSTVQQTPQYWRFTHYMP